MKQIRESSENVLLLDGGNTLFGNQPLVRQTQGQAIVEAMNMLGYDAMVLGSEDFRLGLDVLRERMEEAEFPILSANVVMAGTDELFATPYIIKEIGDHKAAIIGLTSQEAATAAGGDVDVLDPLETLEDTMDEIGKEADIIVTLSHLGAEVSFQLPGQVQGIDLIVGGGSRDSLNPPQWNETSSTVFAQAGYQGQRIGIVSLEIDSEGKVVGHQGEVMFLTDALADDLEMRAFLDQYR